MDIIIDNYKKKNSKYLQDNPSWHVEDSAWKAKQVLSLMKKNNINPNSIVEIGCGAGEILSQILKTDKNVNLQLIGYDISPDLEGFWNERASSRLNFFKLDLLQEEKYFDLLLMIDVFEHVEDYFSFIKAAGSKADYKIYHIPLDMSVFSVLRNAHVHARLSVGHLHYFSKESALSTLRDCGQTIIDYSYTNSALELNPKILRTRLFNLFRKSLFYFNKDLAVRIFGGFSLVVLTK